MECQAAKKDVMADPTVVGGMFPIKGKSDEETKAEFYDHFIKFIQDGRVKNLNYGRGILESIIGLDYKSLL